ncbi:MAG: CPBP family intramembrane metalloprotease [Armatimonadetes bacterium]|nr:CPBP family intramembrane metalloprotease [Armatimonadota bacterium]
MKRAGLLVAILLAGWTACWLLPGLLLGSPAAVLSGGAPAWARGVYLVGLYASLLAGTRAAWRRCGPRTLAAYPWGWQRARRFFLAGALGVVTAGLHRIFLFAGGWWEPSAPSEILVVSALVTAPLLGLAEEYVFRGYFFGVVREELGRGPAYLLVNGLFALVHLFRPGSCDFKLGYALGLFLSGAVLCLVVERWGDLWGAAGLHAGWTLIAVLEGPQAVHPSLVAGLGGEPAAGLIGWILLGLLALTLPGRACPSDRAPMPEPQAS